MPLIVIIVFGAMASFISGGFIASNPQVYQAISRIATPEDERPTPTPTTQPQQNPNLRVSTPTNIPVQKQVYVDPDPYMDCKYPHLGTLNLRSSQCKTYGECPIGNGYYLFPSLETCRSAQLAYSSGNTANFNSYINSYSLPHFQPMKPPTYQPYINPGSSDVNSIPTPTYDVQPLNIQPQDNSPKDRDGRPCWSYPPELKSYSNSMGCP